MDDEEIKICNAILTGHAEDKGRHTFPIRFMVRDENDVVPDETSPPNCFTSLKVELLGLDPYQ
jgi:hypothetical protein